MIPLSFLFIPYGICLVFLGFFALVDLFQVIRWSTTTEGAIFLSIIFLGGVAIILTATYQMIGTINWAQTLPLLSAFGAPSF